MITTLSATTTDRIVSELIDEGAAAGRNRVLTLLVSTDADGLEDALEAAHGASRDHPCRVVAVVNPPEDDAPAGARSRDGHAPAGSTGHLDAQIRVGHDAGAGETIVLLPWGQAAEHTDTLVVPFLLPDVPVVAWWPGQPPENPSKSPLGRLATTRVTNTPSQPDPAEALATLAPVYEPGDIDLAWTRITLWRAMVASTLDGVQREHEVKEVVVAGEPGNASLSLMIRWLALRLCIPVRRRDVADAEGISSITATTEEGTVEIARKDAGRVVITQPGTAEPQVVTMARRAPIVIMSEELRRLAPDAVYAEVLEAFGKDHHGPAGSQVQEGREDRD